jgi:hypothetical protein
MTNIKIYIMGVRNINFLVGENWIPCFKINGSGNDFRGNGLPIFGQIIIYLIFYLNKLSIY